MPSIDPTYTINMTDQHRSWFYAEYERARKDEVIGVLLAIFLGGLGVHHFYLRRNTAGIVYLLFSWTAIPMILGWIEAFFMPGRVRQYNAAQVLYISTQILASNGHSAATAPSIRCPTCASPIDPAASFCTYCGEAIHRTQLSTQPSL